MILLRIKGGLGNQMFQYATARALAHRHQTIVKIDTTLLRNKSSDPEMIIRDFELNDFNFKPLFASQEEIERFNPAPGNTIERVSVKISKLFSPLRTYLESGHSFDPEVCTLPDDYCIVGAFQTEKYFMECRSLIEEELMVTKPLSSKAERLQAHIRDSNAACLHVRRGDYVSSTVYSSMLGTQRAEYYEQGLDYLSKKNGPLTPFVFSDDMDWCKKELRLPENTVFVDSEIMEDDHHLQLSAMTKCRHFVISNSTFGWWAAWLAKNPEKIIVAPKIWFRDSSRNENDIVPSMWVKM